ncbi:type III secretion system inner membrane ring lipoprotein SctJ [Variovorax saccharolyticus]|uniref:type III secretion system inner membrane ring lipoprotein SctJ n=1 Tax=Variovorax saccharolyticus TaxID=3053516 RepID=UPI0025787E30|nr:type III secretion inner membrane ring lipoprotein SctJ [Variovorax sp. J31P216]MDM0030161.1 type III secretion inner membrane ring lipoprotein SctJ [Variovorax sp. J31P216]
MSGRIFSTRVHAPRLFAALCLILLLSACSKRVDLVTGMADADANEVMSALLNARIPAQKIPNKAGLSVDVPAEQMLAAIEVLENAGLPRVKRARIGEIFKKENLVSSPLEERARYLYALSQELEDTLLRIDGVIVARVQVVLPERSAIGETPAPSSASVFLKHQADVSLDGLVPKISSLVANSIPGLPDKKVSVILVPARVPPSMRVGETSLTKMLFFRVEQEAASELAFLLICLSVLALIGLVAGMVLAWKYAPFLRAALARWVPAGRAAAPPAV